MAISCSSSRMAAATGIATSAPMMPSSTRADQDGDQADDGGHCTARPMIRGTIR
jgi:hypothetical protein